MDNSTPDISLQLIRYIDGELDENDKRSLEIRLRSETLLREEYENLLAAREALLQYGLRKKVSNIHDQMMEHQMTPVRTIPGTGRKFRYRIAVAASLLFLAGTLLVYNYLNISSAKIYSNHYLPYELSSVRDHGTPEKPIEKAYRSRNFAEIKRIRISGEDKSIKAEFLTGMAYLETNDLDKAIHSFNEVTELNRENPSAILNDEAEYYLALAYIKNQDHDKALALLEKIRDDKQHTYHGKVSGKMISQLKRLRKR